MSGVVVLFSGGLDSTVLAHKALSEGNLKACAFFLYGQANAEMESRVTRSWCLKHNITCLRTNIPMDAQAMHIGVGESGSRFVPGRNMLFISHGISYAVQVGASEVWLGANADDYENYADCRPDFISNISAAASAYGISVKAPLLNYNKRQIVEMASGLNVNVEATWTCYEPKWLQFEASPCGSCDACRLRDSVIPRPSI